MTLPREETAFFGRRGELADIEARLSSSARLVTVVGLGGIGKTRLAIAAASRWKSQGGVAFASLADARSLESAVREIASAAGVRIPPESKAKSATGPLAKALAARGSSLLVLDNVEQLGDAAREIVSALLDGARELRILATSREALGVRGEEKLVLGALGDDDARALFVDRARAAKGAQVTIADDEALAIVRRVDQLPLAIELAASRLELLSPKELLGRLDDKLDVLASRTTTMRATLDWSWDLLGEAERDLLVRASVFAAPFGIDAAEEILERPGTEILDVLESLLRKSLLTRAEGIRGGARLAMFETVRTWAREKLDPKAAAEIRARHATVHLAEAERWAISTYGKDGVRALDALTELLPDLLAAFEATKNEAPATAARIVLALSDLLLFRGLFELRAELFEAGAEAAARASDDRLLARALVAKARVTLETGRMEDAETELRRALELATRVGDDQTRAEATRSLGWMLTATSRLADAEASLTSALAMHREQGSARGFADAHVALGILRAFQGRAEDGLGHLREALAIHVEQGDVIRQEKVLGFASLVGHDAREVARGLPREVLARAPASSLDVLPPSVAELVASQKEVGERWHKAIDLYRVGVAAQDRGDATAAIEAFERALAALGRAGVTRGVAVVHAHAAVAFAESGDGAEAEARLALARESAKHDPASDLVVEVFGAAVSVVRAPSEESASQARAILGRASRAEGATPELAIARKTLERLLAPVPASAGTKAAAATLVVGQEARWMTPPGGERVDLVRYGPVRRLLDRLVGHRLAHPGVALTAEDLIEAGWPGERMRHTAGLLRVYSAIRRLRRLGLETVLVTRDDGYLLDAHTEVRVG